MRERSGSDSLLARAIPHAKPLGASYHKGRWVDIAHGYGMDRFRFRPQRRFAAEGLNLLASGAIATQTFVTGDSMLGCILAVVYTLLYWHFGQELAVNMSWHFVSLAVIFPISQGIAMGFRRREAALGEFGRLLGNLHALWGAVMTWKVQNKEKKWVRMIECLDEPSRSAAAVHQLYDELFVGLIAYFDLPRWGRARHALTWCRGEQVEQERLKAAAHEQRLHVDSALSRLQKLVQDLKTVGLPGGEAHRLDQYICLSTVAFERLTVIKEYRTPQAFRAFARVYLLVVGALYGPYYVHLGQGRSGTDAHLSLALAFACAIQLAMSGLFNLMLGLEDAFARRGGRGQLDSVRVPELVEVARQHLLRIEHEALLDWRTSATAALARADPSQALPSWSAQYDPSMESRTSHAAEAMSEAEPPSDLVRPPSRL